MTDKPAGAIDDVTETAARIVATRIMRQAVEEAWYDRTKGDLMLDAPDHDEALAEIVDKLHAYAADTIAQVSSAQHDAGGNEITEVDDNELARRIAAALDIVLYGGPA